MRKFKSYIGLLLFAAIGFTGCQDDFDTPVLAAPQASISANTSIKELKSKYWEDGLNYIDTIGTTDDGARMIISGYVISSDRTGNIYKNLVIEDETGALAMSINQSGLYNSYRIGQEVVIDVTGMYIGKYNGLQQLGWPDVDEVFGEQATFMPIEFFRQHAQLNGLPDEKNVQPTVVNLADIASFTVNDKEEMIEWQSRLVRFNNVRFEDGKGNLSYTDGSEINSNRTLYDEHGNQIIVRNSGYATFWSDKLPKGYGDVVGILSYYDDAWQLLLRSTDDCMNFGNPTKNPGTETNPYTVLQAIEEEKAGKEVTDVWVKGYIVGAVAPEVEDSVVSNDNIEWGAPATLANTLVIAESADVKDFRQCLIISLPMESKLREYANLRDNPDNLGKEIMLKGNLEKYMETYGITGNNGTTSEFKLAGSNSDSTIPAGDGSETSPYNVTQVLSGIEATGVWASGYIVGWVDGMTYSTGVSFSVPATSATNVIIADRPDETDYNRCVPVQLPAGELRSAINLQDNPGNLGKKLNYKGALTKYFGVRGLKEGTEYKLDGAGSGNTPEAPIEPLTYLDETFEGGTSFAGINWTIAEVKGDKPWWIRNFNNNNYATVSGFNGTAPFDEWLISPPINISATDGKILTFETQAKGYGATTSSLEVYVLTTDNPETATKTKLNATICDTPADAYSNWTSSGNIDLNAFSGTIYIAFRYQATADANYATYCLDNVKIGTGGSDIPDDPTPPVTTANAADLNTLNNGTAKSSYGTYSTAAGWTLENGNVLSGRTSGEDSNPYFAFIGEDGTLAACLNGKVSTPGKLTSPTLTGGIKTLTFNYGFAYSDKQCKFTVNVKQGGTVAKTETVTMTSIEQKKAYTFTMDVNLSGDFTIEVVNDAMGGETGNKERVAIWNLSWTN